MLLYANNAIETKTGVCSLFQVFTGRCTTYEFSVAASVS